MNHVAPILCLAASMAAAAGCARGLYGPSINTPVSNAPRDLDEVTVEMRRALLDRADIWRPIDTARLNLLTGPGDAGAFAFDAPVACAFHYPDKPLSGVTPKFECALRPDDVFKVKYGEQNGEVFAEVAASRLFWALGFTVDRMYPVKLTCINCPADPHKVSTLEWNLGKPGNLRTQVYDPATVERKVAGEEVEVDGYKGWSWREIESVADNSVGASRAEIDALKLLAAFVQHVDNKPDNQAIVCVDDTIARDREGNATCRQPVLIVKDLGSTFAAASRFSFAKMKLESWRSVPIWKDKTACQADLTRSLVGTLEHPVISEAGRQLLADRLSLLSDRQLRDLFTAARVERRKDSIHGRQATADDWVQAFKDKRGQIVNHRCLT
jgi:hypothetical protein